MPADKFLPSTRCLFFEFFVLLTLYADLMKLDFNLFSSGSHCFGQNLNIVAETFWESCWRNEGERFGGNETLRELLEVLARSNEGIGLFFLSQKFLLFSGVFVYSLSTRKRPNSMIRLTKKFCPLELVKEC